MTPFLVYFNPFSITFMTYKEAFSSRIHLIFSIAFVFAYFVLLRSSAKHCKKYIVEAVNCGLQVKGTKVFNATRNIEMMESLKGFLGMRLSFHRHSYGKKVARKILTSKDFKKVVSRIAG